ncbi:MAG TPA: hypothetical protein VK151_18885 [Fluviicola sp.]|nr:hypothetical protein [Fluviicola sp.]
MKTIFRVPLMMIALVAVGVVFSSSGCRKKKDTIAKIYVLDTTNSYVSGATVRVKGESTTSQGNQNVILDKTTTTNASGEATFNFNDVYQLGQAGVAVLNIEASYGPLVGQGIIKVEQETTSEETVFIQ